MRLFPQLAVFVHRDIPIRFQLGEQLRFSGVSFFRRAAWNGLGSQLAHLFSLFEIPFDGRPRDAKNLDNLVSWSALIDGTHHSFSQIC
jgi:hypothetical protein